MRGRRSIGIPVLYTENLAEYACRLLRGHFDGLHLQD